MRRLKLIMALVVVGAVVGLCAQSTYIAALDHYRRTDDPRVIVIVVMTGVGDKILTQSLHEDASFVTLTARVWPMPGLKPALAVPHLVTVTLAAPLGDRSVVDPSRGVPQAGGSPRPIAEVTCPSTWDARCQWR